MAAIDKPASKTDQMVKILSPLIAADTEHNFPKFTWILGKILKEHPFTFQQVETVLRLKNCRTYLIARKRNESQGPGLTFAYPAGTLKTYWLFTTMKSKEIAMHQLLEESDSYADNFKKLSDTGFVVINDHIPLPQQFLSGKTYITQETLDHFGLKDPSQPVTHINPTPTTSLDDP
ncbi:MAG: hypothetical protein JSS10_03890 [Verrucomicrobia bacterium]|nr:hypothetical protein [Verrucomicrobiota bacterium]